MGSRKLKGKDLQKIGIPEGRIAEEARKQIDHHFGKKSKSYKRYLLKDIFTYPHHYLTDEQLGELAKNINALSFQEKKAVELNAEKTPYAIFGEGQIEQGVIDQMNIAMQLPVAQKGALMADAHQGYGLPIGGVLATQNAVIPYGVGLDIGCRMSLSVFPFKESWFYKNRNNLGEILVNETRFGQATFQKKHDDPVFANEAFKNISIAKKFKDKAYKQLGSSGGGNHFVEFGLVTIPENNPWLLESGNYLGLLSHSGSRGLGAGIAEHFTKIAMEKCQLPKNARHLAWLYLDTQEGQEYWEAMQLAGAYASACHHFIHHRIASELGESSLINIEHHHNFAWKEKNEQGEEWIIHRKGATPAKKADIGIIPGSMISPAYIVSGKANPASLNSASHGAGRTMSRRQAKLRLSDNELKKLLKENDVSLYGSDLDEAPMAYKNIHDVMEQQEDLVAILGKFYPKIVRMAGSIERFK